MAKAAQILMTAFHPKTRFLKQWSIEAEHAVKHGEQNRGTLPQ